MSERRYGFRFSAIEAGFLVVSVVLVSGFVFVAGVYVGKGVEAHKTAQLTPPVRMPIQIPEELHTTTNPPLTWKLPKDKPVGAIPPGTPGIAGDSVQSPSPSTQTPAASTPASTTKKTTAIDVSPGERLDLTADKPQPKTVESPQSLLPKRAAPVKDSPPNPTVAVQTDKPEEQTSKTRTAVVSSLTNESLTNTKEAPSPAQKVTRPAKGWKVQVEATSREETAQEIAKALRAQGYEPSVSRVTKQGEVWYRVRIGRFTTQEEAVAAITRFRREGKFSQAYPVSE